MRQLRKAEEWQEDLDLLTEEIARLREDLETQRKELVGEVLDCLPEIDDNLLYEADKDRLTKGYVEALEDVQEAIRALLKEDTARIHGSSIPTNNK